MERKTSPQRLGVLMGATVLVLVLLCWMIWRKKQPAPVAARQDTATVSPAQLLEKRTPENPAEILKQTSALPPVENHRDDPFAALPEEKVVSSPKIALQSVEKPVTPDPVVRVSSPLELSETPRLRIKIRGIIIGPQSVAYIEEPGVTEFCQVKTGERIAGLRVAGMDATRLWIEQNGKKVTYSLGE